jgi:outer membrane lipoprotein carrier protein
MNNMRRMGSAGTFVILLFAPLSMLFASQKAEDVLDKVRKRYDAVTDAELQFTEKVRFPMTKIEQQLSGTLYIKKNNKYRVEMDDQVIVTDGQTVWSYSASNNQVVIDRFKEDEQSLTPEKILVGAPENFTATVVGQEKIGAYETTILKLVPKDNQSFIHSLRLWVDEKEWMIRQVEIIDVSEKQTTYAVLQVHTNTGLQDSRFEYRIPKGADVVDLR